MSIQKLDMLSFPGEFRVVNTSKINYCLDSADDFVESQFGKVVIYNRGNNKNQICKITKGINDDFRIITDNQKRRLASF